jgi:hypothetical protein
VQEIRVDFTWFSGLAASQKKKSILSWHSTARSLGIGDLLEVSTKSDDPLGVSLSAFNLGVPLDRGGHASLEAVYQSCKVFEHGGPYSDLVFLEPQQARRDARLRTSGALIGFRFGDREYPLNPARAFYDWLFIRALVRKPEIVARLNRFNGFTDIEFNPDRSVSTQAHAVAAVVSLQRRGWLESAARSFAGFAEVLGWSEGDATSRNDQYTFR